MRSGLGIIEPNLEIHEVGSSSRIHGTVGPGGLDMMTLLHQARFSQQICKTKFLNL